MTPRQRVLHRAEVLGATIEENDPMWPHVLDVEAVAPDGERWACDGVHALVAVADEGWTNTAWLDLFERMVTGLEPCPADCDCRGEVKP